MLLENSNDEVSLALDDSLHTFAGGREFFLQASNLQEGTFDGGVAKAGLEIFPRAFDLELNLVRVRSSFLYSSAMSISLWMRALYRCNIC